MNIQLKIVNKDDGKDIYEFLCDLKGGENGFYISAPKDLDDFKNILNELIENSYLEKDGRVLQETYWMSVDNNIVGVAKIRLRLNDHLLLRGGNIGCSISPKYRGKGYGRILLEEGLKILKNKGNKRALITVNENNIPSRKVVEKNKGILENIIDSSCRYWIEL